MVPNHMSLRLGFEKVKYCLKDTLGDETEESRERTQLAGEGRKPDR